MGLDLFKRRPPLSVHLRGEHEKMKSRPWSFVQDRGPVLGKDLRSEVGRARKHVRRPPPSSEKSMKRGISKSRPWSFVQDRGPVLGEQKSGSSFRRSASRFLVLSPRSGTGTTQSYWRHEVVLAAEGDWRFQGTRSRMRALRDDICGL